MTPRCRIAVTAIAAALSWITPAFAQTEAPSGEDTLSRAEALSRGGRADLAYALLQPLAKARAGDPAFDFLLGVAAVDSGHSAEAIVALQRVAAQQPGNAAARAELARAYALAGDVDTARREFDTVLGDPTLPDPVRQRFVGILAGLDRAIAGGGTDVSGFIEGGIGYDSNVNSATSLSAIVIPLFAALGPASLSPRAVSQSDGFARGEGGVSVLHGLGRQDRIFASAYGSAKGNVSVDGFDQAFGALTAGYSHTLATGTILAASVQGQRFWFAGRTYRTGLGGTLQATLPVGGGKALIASAHYADLSYATDRLRDGDRYGAGLSYATRRIVTNVQLGAEGVRDRGARQFAHLYVSAGLSSELPLSARASIVTNSSIERRDYRATDPLFLRERADWQIDVGAGLRLRLGERLLLRPSLTYTRTTSTIALYAFRRMTAAIAVRTEF
jgi:hypothetical protein